MILIVGGSRGLGKKLTERLSLTEKVLILSRSLEEKSSKNLYQVPFDINRSDYKDFESKINEKELKAVFFTVGVVNPDDNLFLDHNEIDIIFQTNFLSIAKIISHLIQDNKFDDNALICFCSSISTFIARDRQVFYSTSKKSLDHYSRSLRYYFLKNEIKIRVANLILGFLDSDMGINKKKKIFKSSIDEIAKKISSNYTKMNGDLFVPRYWFFIYMILKILPLKVTISLLRLIKM